MASVAAVQAVLAVAVVTPQSQLLLWVKKSLFREKFLPLKISPILIRATKRLSRTSLCANRRLCATSAFRTPVQPSLAPHRVIKCSAESVDISVTARTTAAKPLQSVGTNCPTD
jgi:hypothetical protein